ncbi:NUDIX hydrolase [Fibrisoma limi BUZ 3]|uniref:NUDIX hydrolase n=1 Tax=Fibrisoma limi BUZ 3 TaxID=1185876 RepID=I2GBH5_9BACT|nr:NUDIX hydrolase [Fibrisoma limi BUZ 3]
MQRSTDMNKFLSSEQDWLPSLSVDCVIFGFHENELKVLLLTFRHTDLLALPGGLVHRQEDVDDAAKRILAERTGLADIYLEQFHTFGQLGRGSDQFGRKIAKANGIDLPPDHWFTRRFVSVGYYALVDFSRVIPSPDVFSESIDWYDVRELPPLVLDHSLIVQKALDTLRLMLDHRLIGFNLLPEMFTMGELQRLYETILGKKLLRTNFQRKMLSLEILERLDKKWTGGAHKAPYLYRFDTKKGEEYLNNGDLVRKE